ncbi:diguanylate cyclase [Sphingomonas sp. A2-49]|uniref:GGDEF domain-containing protein n=1 Tax=Sphingomonas sp. A2-49 TaxID=1391375 RepID=UPI0021D26934|nr:diguanylate cyclase [Sphingomonas sp. A2-49]MCU6452785.1 diguanylate cyclase [Sphingomonas sp. A2-49]
MVKQGGIGIRAIRFLDDHGLDHTPDHYAFAHRYLAGQDRPFAAAVNHEIEGGVRLRADSVRALMPGDPAAATAANFGELATQLLGLLTNTASATGDLNRDLVKTAAALVSAEPPRVRNLVVFMIERTAETEASLSAALRQAQALRDTLNGARDDIGRDPVTGLPGVDSMTRRLEASIADAGNCAIAIVDIDQRAQLTLEHGAEMEQRLLKAASLTLCAACSPYQVGRWGDAPFLVLVDDPDIATAIARLEAACADMASRNLKRRETDEPIGRITLSAGVATTRGRDAGQVAAAAMRLLAEAKRAGGNRVVAEPRLIAVSPNRA